MKKNNLLFIKALYYCLRFFKLHSYESRRLIRNGDQWSYFDNGYLKDNWFEKLNHPNWKTGYTPLGYGDRLITTPINYGNDQDNKETDKIFY